MPERQIRICEDADELSIAVAEAFVARAGEAIARTGRFTVALAGGSTPKRLYQLLADPPYRDRIDWSKLECFWNDERAVPPDHPDSNFRLAWEPWLSRVPVAEARIHRMPGEAADADQAALDYQQQIADALGVVADGPPPAFDLMLLGIGEDGHTASLFPNTAALDETSRWVVANSVPQRQMYRLTMTLPLLNRARHVIFLVTGASKAAVVREILAGPADPRRLPAQAVQPTAGQLLWLLDREAAGQLEATAP
jgi:6-phosphogluconolactonase